MSTMLQETVLETNGSELAGTMQLVSFHLAEEIFGVAITKVREINWLCDITRIPQTPHYVKGLMNLRSTVIPVVDGVVRLGKQLLILLDIDKILGQEEGTLATAVAGA